MKEFVEKIFGSKKFGEPKKNPQKKEEAKKSQSSIFSTILKAAGAALILILIAAGWFVLMLSGAGGGGAPPAPPTSFSGNFDLQIFSLGTLSYGAQEEGLLHQGFLMIDYVQQNVSSISIDAKLYSTPPSRQVFVLQYPRDGADTYGEFRRVLELNLAKKGWVANDAQLEDLRNMPGGSTIIIPTGYLPSALLGENGFPSITELAARGITIIYIGQPFDAHVLSPSGALVRPDSGALKNSGIVFEKNLKMESDSGFRLEAPLYKASSKAAVSSMLWGSASQVEYKSGRIIFIPESLDGGWAGDGTSAGEDIARLAGDEPYLLALREQKYEISQQIPQGGRITLFFEPMEEDTAFLRITYAINDSYGNVRQGFFDWNMERSANGELFIDNPVINPDYLGGGRKTIIASLREPQAQCVNLFFELYRNGSSIEQIPVEQQCTKTNIDRSAPIQFSQKPGKYILRVVDRAGKVYAAAAVELAGLDISEKGESGRGATYSWREGEFNFTFYSMGKKKNVPRVSVGMEGQPKARKADFTSTDFISYRPGIEFERGDYTFVFDFGSGYVQKKELSYNYAVPIWERLDVIGLALLGALTFSIGFYLRRPQKQMFALDIPDFPPHSLKKIPLSTAQVLNIFEQINKDYRWERMPLSPEEIKSGFRKIIVDGRGVVIGDYNLERLLETLEGKGLVATELGFWAPSAWIRESGKSMLTLGMYRYLRDLFVNNAIRFSKLGAIGGCDVKIIIGRLEYFLHFYLGDDAVIERALKTVNAGYTWVLFKNKFELEDFKEKLRSSSPAFLVLKMHVESRRVRLFSLEQMSKVLKRLRVM